MQRCAGGAWLGDGCAWVGWHSGLLPVLLTEWGFALRGVQEETMANAYVFAIPEHPDGQWMRGYFAAARRQVVPGWSVAMILFWAEQAEEPEVVYAALERTDAAAGGWIGVERIRPDQVQFTTEPQARQIMFDAEWVQQRIRELEQ
jgi:hypothetical protein